MLALYVEVNPSQFIILFHSRVQVISSENTHEVDQPSSKDIVVVDALREIVKYIYFLSHKCWNSPTQVIFFDFEFVKNKIYPSKWYKN